MGKISVKRNILIVSVGPPGWGGAATASYHLFRRMQGDGHNVHYMCLLDEIRIAEDQKIFGEKLGNPLGLEGVTICVLKRPLDGPHPEVRDSLIEIGANLVIAYSHSPTVFIKEATPEVPVIFYVSGSTAATALLISDPGLDAVKILERLDKGEQFQISNDREVKAVALADRIVANSELSHRLLRGFHPGCTDKLDPVPTWEAEWVHGHALEFKHLALPFDERDIDVLFVASNWDREVKNCPMVRQIVASMPDKVIHVLGLAGETVEGAISHGLVPEIEEVFRLFGRARVLVCPSRLDAAPGVLYEGAALGCNLVASRNCGNSRIVNQKLLVDSFTTENFVEVIERALVRPSKNDVKYLVDRRGYRNLIDLAREFELPPKLPPRLRATGDEVDYWIDDLCDSEKGYIVVRDCVSAEECERYRLECARFFEKGPVVHARINRPDMFNYVHHRYIAPDGKVWSTKDARRQANICRIYQFLHNRQSADTRILIQRILALRNRIEERFLHDAAYRTERERLMDYVQVTHFLNNDNGLSRHRDCQTTYRYPFLQPFTLLSEPGEDFDGGNLVVWTRTGRAVRFPKDIPIGRGDLVLFDRRLEHGVDPTLGAGRSGVGRWSVVVGARDYHVGRYVDRYRYSNFWVRRMEPLGEEGTKVSRALRALYSTAVSRQSMIEVPRFNSSGCSKGITQPLPLIQYQYKV